jgi:excisionase family DNA binding protein
VLNYPGFGRKSDRLLGVSKDTIYAWIAKKHMPAHRVGRLWKFQKNEIDDWVKAGGASEAPENSEGS